MNKLKVTLYIEPAVEAEYRRLCAIHGPTRVINSAIKMLAGASREERERIIGDLFADGDESTSTGRRAASTTAAAEQALAESGRVPADQPKAAAKAKRNAG